MSRYVTVDVFTDHLFGGNQLAVFPDAAGMSTELMQAITREFNFSETTFVLPPNDPRHAARVRIFTPGGELPFAGHPTVGTAHALAELGAIPLTGDVTNIVFEEGVGPVEVSIRSEHGRPTFVQLTVARLPEVLRPPPPAEVLARMLSLEPEDLANSDMEPQTVSCGVPYLLIPLRDREAVARACLNTERWTAALSDYVTGHVYPFALDGERRGSDVHARMFAPDIGIAEDPATGSAAVALGGYLAARDPRFDGRLRWVLEQGFEMGRPSILEVEADKTRGEITAVRVGGRSVIVCEGTMRLPATGTP